MLNIFLTWSKTSVFILCTIFSLTHLFVSFLLQLDCKHVKQVLSIKVIYINSCTLAVMAILSILLKNSNCSSKFEEKDLEGSTSKCIWAPSSFKVRQFLMRLCTILSLISDCLYFLSFSNWLLLKGTFSSRRHVFYIKSYKKAQ